MLSILQPTPEMAALLQSRLILLCSRLAEIEVIGLTTSLPQALRLTCQRETQLVVNMSGVNVKKTSACSKCIPQLHMKNLERWLSWMFPAYKSQRSIFSGFVRTVMMSIIAYSFYLIARLLSEIEPIVTLRGRPAPPICKEGDFCKNRGCWWNAINQHSLLRRPVNLVEYNTINRPSSGMGHEQGCP